MPSPPSSRKAGRTAPRVVRRLLKDGTVRVHVYPPYQPKPKGYEGPDSVNALIRAWSRSPEWDRLAANTKAVYTTYLRDVSRIGATRAADVKRRDLLDIRDAIATARGTGAATGFVRAASALFAWGVDREWIEHSPAARVKTLKGGHLPAWTMEDVALASKYVPEALRRAVVLALYTGQRRGDLVRMAWSDYDGTTIRVRQEKTGAQLVVPCHPELRRELETWKAARRAVTILENGTGASWVPVHLTAQLAYHLARVPGFPPRHNIHGLRKLAAARLADAGCSTHQIAAITGHRTLAMVALYTASADQERLAGAAITTLSRATQQRAKTSTKTGA